MIAPASSAHLRFRLPLSAKWRDRLRVTWATPWNVDFSANWRYMAA